MFTIIYQGKKALCTRAAPLYLYNDNGRCLILLRDIPLSVWGEGDIEWCGDGRQGEGNVGDERGGEWGKGLGVKMRGEARLPK